MQTDHIDLYQMHHVDRTATWDEVWQAMETLVAQGKIIYVGSSNFAGWHITQANEQAKARGSLGLVSEQSHYNLLVRTVELEVLPACRDYGVGVIPWSPLSGGLLGGVLGTEPGSRRRSAQRNDASRSSVLSWRSGKVCAPSWARIQPRSHWRGSSSKTVSPARSSARGPSIISTVPRCVPSTCRSTSRRCATIDTIFPGPGGSAPEAYAW